MIFRFLTTRKRLNRIIDKKREQNTYNSNGNIWTIPDNHLMIPVSELKKL